MKNEQKRIIHFEINNNQGLSVTHGYNISNVCPDHFHSTYTLGIIETGERELTYRGKKTVLKQNDIFIIQPFELHNCKSLTNSNHSYKIISFNLAPFYYFPQLIIHYPPLLSSMREFHALAEKDKSSPSLMSLYEDITMQLKTTSLGKKQAIIDKEISAKIYRTKLFIEQNCHLDISLKEMSSMACLSEFHFNRHFHKCFGLSPYSFYLVCKMKRSQKVLIEHQTVIETMNDVGFFDQSHFTKLFKKHIGVTPGQYLRDNRNDNSQKSPQLTSVG